MTDLELLEELKKIDTPTITNVVATYPGRPLCLEIYNPWTENWYTNNTLSCWYPEMGPIAGYAVTCTYGLPDPTFKKLSLMEVLEAMDKHGAVKFPADRLEEVVRNAKALLAEEDERVGQLLRAKGLQAVKAIMGGHQY